MSHPYASHLIVILFFSCQLLFAQENQSSKWAKILENYQIKASAGLQFMGTYTLNQKIYDPGTNRYEKVDNRWNLQMRRFRFNLTGQAYPSLTFKFTGAIDLVGRDVLSATVGGANNGRAPNFGLWNAYLQWRLLTQNEGLFLTFGYLSPQISRASLNSAMRATSFEKSWVQNYMRRTLVGTGPGRAPGINLGGQLTPSNTFAVSYDFGLFNPVNNGPLPNTQGLSASPLLTARLVFHFGDPETKNYSLSHRTNYFGQRNGLSFALAASHRGASDLFDRSQTIGADFLLNLGHFNLDGEWNYLIRESQENTSQANVGYFRFSYSIPLEQQAHLEPVFMYVRLNGALDRVGQESAKILGAFAGSNEILDWTINYYFNPNFKLAFSFTKNIGNSGEAAPGSLLNNHYAQNGIGAIERGDLIGLGMTLIL
ncbi:MAG: hypothetical protein Sapg2KO_34380 [Saprospiraceae bacterium]